MATISTGRRRVGPAPMATSRRLTAALLACGVGYGAAYVVLNDVVAASLYDGYSRLDQAVSELSATGAPPQALLRWTLPLQTVLLAAYGVGVWRAAGRSRALRGVAATLVGFAISGLLWLPFPMSSREDIAAGRGSTDDVGHLAMAGLTVTLIVTMVSLSAVALHGWLRAYAVVTLVVVLAAGAATSIQSGRLPDGEPTPLLGLYERIDIGAWLLWLSVLAAALFRRTGDAAAS